MVELKVLSHLGSRSININICESASLAELRLRVAEALSSDQACIRVAVRGRVLGDGGGEDEDAKVADVLGVQPPPIVVLRRRGPGQQEAAAYASAPAGTRTYPTSEEIAEATRNLGARARDGSCS